MQLWASLWPHTDNPNIDWEAQLIAFFIIEDVFKIGTYSGMSIFSCIKMLPTVEILGY